MAAPWSCAVTPSWGPSKSSWSSNSSSICRRNHHHASPRQQRRFPSHPTPCSGDFRDAPVDLTHFFPPVEKVGLTNRPRKRQHGKEVPRTTLHAEISGRPGRTDMADVGGRPGAWPLAQRAWSDLLWITRSRGKYARDSFVTTFNGFFLPLNRGTP